MLEGIAWHASKMSSGKQNQQINRVIFLMLSLS